MVPKIFNQQHPAYNSKSALGKDLQYEDQQVNRNNNPWRFKIPRYAKILILWLQTRATNPGREARCQTAPADQGHALKIVHFDSK